MEFSRRKFVGTSLAVLAVFAVRPALSRAQGIDAQIDSGLLRRALNAADRHYASIAHRDYIGVANFSLHSNEPRFHVLNLAEDTMTSHLVAHGRGSDPAHTGWLKTFSNAPRSQATSAGAYTTGSTYTGGHGRSIRLDGLDSSNSNAASRAIVIHAAWYVSEAIVTNCGMLGRSEGCLALANSSLKEVLAKFGPGRLIYADKA